MNKATTRFFVQQGSSQDLRVSDNDAWYVVRQTWPDITGARSSCQIETKCKSRQDAIDLCQIYNEPPEPLGALAKWSGVDYNTLVQAARAEPQRLKAEKSGKVWMSTRRDVHEYKARMIPKSRKEKKEMVNRDWLKRDKYGKKYGTRYMPEIGKRVEIDGQYETKHEMQTIKVNCPHCNGEVLFGLAGCAEATWLLFGKCNCSGNTVKSVIRVSRPDAVVRRSSWPHASGIIWPA